MTPRLPGLREALAAAPDPDRATRLAESLLDAAGALLATAIATHPAGIAHALFAVCGIAPFLAPIARRDPASLAALAADDLAAPLDAAAFARDLDERLAAAGDGALAVLRRAKYRALARIVARDARLPLAQSGETLGDLTRVAECLLDRALAIAARRVTARLGPPRWRDERGAERDARFAVLGLGKLGGEELNFSSDVDLVYVYEHLEDMTSGPQERSPLDWFLRLGQELQALVATETEDRFLYRIDLDLRPEGPAGPMAISDAMLAEYYENAADHWEKVAFMKARPVAGDLDLGWRVVRQIHPMIYRAAMDTAGVHRIQSWKQRVSAERASASEGFDVKLDPGGIRDVEFVAQALQLLHGGRIPQLRDRSTQRAIARLAEVKLLPTETAARLLDAYRFLRRLENRLQMEDERQTHALPEQPAARLRIARGMGFLGTGAVAAFLAELARERSVVRDFDAAFHVETSAESVAALFARHQPRLVANPETRPLMEALAARFAREIEASPDPALATNNLDRFVASIGSRRFYYELLIDRPELIDRLVALFAGSRFLSALLAKHPRLIEPLFADPELLLLSRDALRADFAALRASLGPEAPPAFERDLDALRLFHHRQVLNVGLLDIDEHIARSDAESALTDLAEVTLEAALAVARREAARTRPPSPAADRAGFAIVGMGKLASRELGYGSDLDLLFLYDLDSENASDRMEAQEHCVRVAQRLISAIETPTENGSCYEIDSRLRPSGNQGALVTSIAGLRDHYSTHAMLWERQALLRARAICGDARAAAAFETLRREQLLRPLPDGAVAEIHRIRLRMESELAAETATRRDLKRGRGGLLDVEAIVSWLQLRHARAHPELLDVDRTERQLAKLRALGLLAEQHARDLSLGWEFLERLASRLRVVENRSISDLDAERGDLDGLARRLGYTPGAREASARRALLDDYVRHTDAIRRAYLAVFEIG